MNTCPNCGKVAGLHSSILQGCMCQYSMQAPPQQEPVVGITAIRTWFKDGRVVTQTLCNSWVDTTPPQPQQEPAAIRLSNGVIDVLGTAIVPIGALLYTTPPQRTWVGLTEEEVEDAWRKVEAGDFHDCVLPFAEKLEAKLKEKNT